MGPMAAKVSAQISQSSAHLKDDDVVRIGECDLQSWCCRRIAENRHRR